MHVGIERALAAWLGWRAPPAAWVARSWPDPWSRNWCRRCGCECSGTVLQETGPPLGCSACLASSLPWVGVARLGDFGRLGDAIADLKYRRRWELGRHLGRRLARVAQVDFPRVARAAQAVVPMPMPGRRRRQRGIDHAAIIANAMAARLGLPMRRALVRGDGPRQTGTSRAARRRAVMPGLRLTNGSGIEPELPVVLVDDVLTTGRSCANACRALGCPTVLVAVAAVADPGRPAKGG